MSKAPGSQKKDKSTSTISFRCTPEVKRQIEETCFMYDASISELMVAAWNIYYTEHGERK